MKKLEQNIKLLAVPLVILLVVIVLMLFSAKIILDKITTFRSDVASAQHTNTSLQEKLTSLQEIAPQISDDSTNLLLALPGNDSVLSAISAVKYQAGLVGLTVDTVNATGAIVSTETASSVLEVKVTGNYKDIFSFIGKVRNSAPIIHLSAIKVDSGTNAVGSGTYDLTLSLNSYWAPLPTSISSISDSITPLSGDDMKIVTDATNLEKPILSAPSEATPSAAGKTNPFQ